MSVSSFESQTITFSSGSGQQNLLSTVDRPLKLIVRANNADVYTGGNGVAASLPASGFKLVVDKEYTFDFEPQVGSNSDINVYVATTSGGSVTVSYIVMARR